MLKNFNTQRDRIKTCSFGEVISHDGGVPMDVISALKNEIPRELSYSALFPPGESICFPGSRPSPDTLSTRALILDFSTLRTMANKLFRPRVYGIFVIAAQMD